jgi:hypothetical protein
VPGRGQNGERLVVVGQGWYLSLNVLVQARGRCDKLGDVVFDQVVHVLDRLRETVGLRSRSRSGRGGGLSSMFGDAGEFGSAGRGRQMSSTKVGDSVSGLVKRGR